jgi:hypothetical protein
LTELHASYAFRDALKARLALPDGQKTLDEFARLIVKSTVEVMPPDLLATLGTKEGMAAFREAWPDIVHAFLFRHGTMPPASAGRRKAAKRTVVRRRNPPK